MTPVRALYPDETRPGTVVVPLTGGHVALIDASDADAVGRFNWHARPGGKNSATFYAVRNCLKPDGARTSITLHRFLRPNEGLLDHINLNGLDCRRHNLRPATQLQNVHNARKRRNNTSGYKGVTWHEGTRKWRAQSQLRGKHVSIGLFDTAEEAGRAYAAKMRELHGDFARPFEPLTEGARP